MSRCVDLRFRIVDDRPLDFLEFEALTYLPEAVVEHAMAMTMEQTIYAADLARAMLAHIESSIRTSLDLVFGPLTLI